MGRGCGSGGADLCPRRWEGGGEGAGSGSRRAALPALQRAERPRLSADALAPTVACRTPFRGVSPTPRGGGSGRAALDRRPRTAPPSGAQRWVSKLRHGDPGHQVPGGPSWCWGLGRGKRVAREGLVPWEPFDAPRTLKGFYGPCLVERVRGGGLAGKGCDPVALNS